MTRWRREGRRRRRRRRRRWRLSVEVVSSQSNDGSATLIDIHISAPVSVISHSPVPLLLRWQTQGSLVHHKRLIPRQHCALYTVSSDTALFLTSALGLVQEDEDKTGRCDRSNELPTANHFSVEMVRAVGGSLNFTPGTAQWSKYEPFIVSLRLNESKHMPSSLQDGPHLLRPSSDFLTTVTICCSSVIVDRTGLGLYFSIPSSRRLWASRRDFRDHVENMPNDNHEIATPFVPEGKRGLVTIADPIGVVS